MEGAGFRLGNLDLTIIAERPKLAKHIPAMRENLAAAFGCDISQVSVKATTEEGLGLAGAGIGSHQCFVFQARKKTIPANWHGQFNRNWTFLSIHLVLYFYASTLKYKLLYESDRNGDFL